MSGLATRAVPTYISSYLQPSISPHPSIERVLNCVQSFAIGWHQSSESTCPSGISTAIKVIPDWPKDIFWCIKKVLACSWFQLRDNLSQEWNINRCDERRFCEVAAKKPVGKKSVPIKTDNVCVAYDIDRSANEEWFWRNSDRSGERWCEVLGLTGDIKLSFLKVILLFYRMLVCVWQDYNVK